MVAMVKSTVKKHKALKVILIVLSVIVILCIGGFFIAATHTQIVVGFIQKMADNGKPLNSFERTAKRFERKRTVSHKRDRICKGLSEQLS